MKSASIVLVVLFVLFAASSDAAAQSAPIVGEGSRIRVTTKAGTERVSGTVIRQDEIYLTLREYPGGPLATVARGSITSMDVAVKGKSYAGRGALIGFLGMTAAILLTPESECTGFVCIEFSTPLVIGTLGTLSAGVGALIGATVRRETWVPVQSGVHVGVVPTRKGGALRLSIGF